MISKELEKMIREHFNNQSQQYKFIPGKTKIPLSIPAYGADEVIDALDSLLSTWVTMGSKVKSFEAMFSGYLGCKHGVMVNSGSSANLLALSVLTNPVLKERIPRNSLIITPAVTWATTVYPIVNVGCVPLFVDVDLETYCIDVEEVKKAVSEKTRCIMLVHLLGNPCDMNQIMKIADEHNMYVIEDACEAHGATLEGRKVGSFGDIGTFSFFMSHHITTMEGGMMVTNNESLAEIARAIRAFGWIRDLKDKESLSSMHPDIDPRFLFVNTGYNIRPTEIQGAFGINQLSKLDDFIKIRRLNAKYWNERLNKYSDYLQLPTKTDPSNHVYFGYALTIKENAPFGRKEFTDYLEKKGVETRPVMAGNFIEQPVAQILRWEKLGKLPNSRLIMRNSFFIGNHHGIREKEREYVADVIEEFMKNHL